MIVLDTNVVSELMRATPNPAVVRWVDRQPADELWLTSVTLAELLYGIARLPSSRRKSDLAERLHDMVDEDFDQRIAAFDGVAAAHYADIVATRDKAGRPISMADALIAAICRSHNAQLSTRNTDDFTETGIELANPWIDT